MKTNLKKTLQNINKKYGKDTIRFAKDEIKKERISFGIKEIDDLIGGGSVCGNFVILYGGESVGKSTLAMHQIANAQKLGKTCVYIDLEHGFDGDRATELGVDLDNLLLIEDVKTAEEAMDIIIELCDEKVIDLIIIDSVQAMSPKAEQFKKADIRRSMEKDEIAILAKKLGKFFRVAGTPVYKSKASVVLIGQVRTEGIGSFFTSEGLTGGRALKHWALFTLYMRRGQKADAPHKTIIMDSKGKKESIIAGFDSVIKIEKTKISGSKSELTELHLPFYYETGYIHGKTKK